jgi:signal transduction histidine kinase
VDGKLVLSIGALFVAYAVTAKLGLKFDALNGVATTVWPPTGIALAALLRLGLRLWPGVALGALVVNLQAGAPPVTAAVIAVGNTLEAVVGSALLRRFGFSPALTRLRDVMVLVLGAAVGSTAISATFGTLGVWLGEGGPAAGYAEFWSVWWIGDAIGNLLVAPAILTWSVDLRLGHNYRKWGEAVALAALLVVVAFLSFGGIFTSRASEIVRAAYLVWPLLIGIALRFGPRGSATALLLVSGVGIGATALHVGPFVRPTQHESLRLVQSYLAVTAVTIMTVAAAGSERRQAVVARDEFLSIASHELKTPLTVLKLTLGKAARLAAGIGGAGVGAPPSGPALLAEIGRTVASSQRQVERLERLIEDLLDVSRLRADRVSLQVEHVCLADVVREAAAALAEQVGRAGSTLEVDAPERLDVVCDRGRIEQVLTNLVVNAIKYAPGKPVQVSLRADETRARIAVRDNGPGIPRHEQRRIFEPYRRLASAKHLGGLGLGLYIGRQIAEAHGGALHVYSEPGHGAEFVLELPLAPPPPSPPPSNAGA